MTVLKQPVILNLVLWCIHRCLLVKTFCVLSRWRVMGWLILITFWNAHRHISIGSMHTHIVTVFLVHWRYDIMSSDHYSVIHIIIIIIIIRFFCIWDLPSRCTNWKRKQLPLHVRFEVFTELTMKNAVFWYVVPCRFCVNRRFGGNVSPPSSE